MQTNKSNWLNIIAALFKDTPKNKNDLISILKNAVLDGHIDNESLRMIEGVFRVSEAVSYTHLTLPTKA